jgi:hypothetical protein
VKAARRLAYAVVDLTAVASTLLVYVVAEAGLRSSAAAVLVSVLWGATVLYSITLRLVLLESFREAEAQVLRTRLRILLPADILYVGVLFFCFVWAVLQDRFWLPVSIGAWLTLIAVAFVWKRSRARSEPEQRASLPPGAAGVLPRPLSRKLTAITVVCCVVASCVLILWLMGIIPLRYAGLIAVGAFGAMGAAIVWLVLSHHRQLHAR